MIRSLLLSTALLALLAAGCDNGGTSTDVDCADGKCDGVSDDYPGQPRAHVHVLTHCGQIGYNSNSNQLSFIRDGKVMEADLEWSHPDSTIGYLTDPSFRAALESGSDCEQGADMSVYVNLSGEIIDRNFDSCGGIVGGVVKHLETLANDYFPGVCPTKARR